MQYDIKNSGKKYGKRKFGNKLVGHLANSLGGKESLKNNTPVCAGRYNITNAIEVRLIELFF